jgi:uncharacterized membrane protein YhfC
MVDPGTVGWLVTSVLSMVAEAALKGTVEEIVKNGYRALKERVSNWVSPHDIEALEKTPTSLARQTVIAEVVNAQSPENKESVRVLAETLIKQLKSVIPSMGLDIGRLNALEVQLGNITVTEGIGARIGEAQIQGTFKAGDISVGAPLGKT